MLGSALTAMTAILTPGVGWAATGLIMGGTNNSNPSPGYLQNAAQYYLDPTTSCKVATCALTAVQTPEEFWPVPGWGTMPYDQSITVGAADLDAAIRAQLAADPTGSVVVYGSSQSAGVVTLEKRLLADAPQSVKDHVTFVITGNPNRPNGGLMQRFFPISVPGIDFTFNGPTPTDTGITTYDIVFEYDAVGDFPRYPLNVFTIANMLAATTIHSSYLTSRDGYTEAELQQAINDPANRQTYGDTVYVTIPTKHLPLAELIKTWGTSVGWSSVTTPMADLLEPTLRILVDLGYDRTTPYGRPAPVGLIPPINPVKLATELAQAGRQGVQAAAADLRADPPQPPALRVTGKSTAAPGRPAARSALPPAQPSAGRPTAPRNTTPRAGAKPTGTHHSGLGGPRRGADRP